MGAFWAFEEGNRDQIYLRVLLRAFLRIQANSHHRSHWSWLPSVGQIKANLLNISMIFTFLATLLETEMIPGGVNGADQIVIYNLRGLILTWVAILGAAALWYQIPSPIVSLTLVVSILSQLLAAYADPGRLGNDDTSAPDESSRDGHEARRGEARRVGARRVKPIPSSPRLATFQLASPCLVARAPRRPPARLTSWRGEAS